MARFASLPKVSAILAKGALVAALTLGLGAAMSASPTPAVAASAIAVVVNGEPITTYQIRQRAAFLKLRRVSGNTTQKATDELIDEALKKQEISRQRVSIPQDAVDAAYGNFAKSNKLTEAQLAQVLSSVGFSTEGFKDYIRVQMGWGQAVQAKMRRQDRLSEQDVVQRMLAQGGEKPSTTEYTLQQVILVIPAAQRSAMMSTRMREAEAMRGRFQSCDSTIQLAKSLRDVTVRDLGRVAQPELPSLWREQVIATAPGRTTRPQQTERGVEFIAVCNARSISDDKVAAMVFASRDMESLNNNAEGPDAAVLKELKDTAKIVRR